ncbi:MAG: hypothetical protein IPL35_15435 [Sphingobacteriales bacterium]|nr:hypothetical protein [Sphingobacteriales bacterium]
MKYVLFFIEIVEIVVLPLFFLLAFRFMFSIISKANKKRGAVFYMFWGAISCIVIIIATFIISGLFQMLNYELFKQAQQKPASYKKEIPYSAPDFSLPFCLEPVAPQCNYLLAYNIDTATFCKNEKLDSAIIVYSNEHFKDDYNRKKIWQI